MGTLKRTLWGLCVIQILITSSSSLPFGGSSSLDELKSNILRNLRESNVKVQAHSLANLTIPSYIRSIIRNYRDVSQNGETFVDRLFKRVDNENCKSHVLEWFYRMNNTEEFPLSTKENSWILHMVDSWGKIPEGILRGHVNAFGDYDECVNMKVSKLETHHGLFENAKDSFEGRYCMTYLVPCEVAFGEGLGMKDAEECKRGVAGENGRDVGIQKAVSLTEFIDFLQNSVGIMAPKPSIGTCMPASCTQGDIQNIFMNGLNMTYNSNENITKANMPWALAAICSTKRNSDLDTAAICVIILISTMGALALGAGVYDYWITHYTKGKRPSSLAFKYFMAFSLYTNTKKWLSTRKSAEDFGCLHGMRSLTTAWVVLAHTYAVNMFVPNWNSYDIMHMGDDWTILAVINGFFCVDTFFLMGGTLACYNVLKLLDRSKGKLNIPMFYLHRYLRLTPTYAILIAIGATLLTKMGDGPYWYIMEAQEKFCKDNWWTNLLYINSFVKTDEMCNGESWYLSDDMIFYILCPFMIYPIWKWEKIGLGLSLVYFILSCFSIPILVDYHGTPPTTIVTRKMLNWQTMIYIRPYSRIGVFIVGIWLGWLLYKTRGKQLKIPKLVVLLGWMLSTAGALYVIFCVLPWYRKPDYNPKWYGFFYGGLSRQIWGFAVGWVIFACIKGYGGLVNRFLSWSVFMPLGRLTFCIYLTSYHLQQMFLLKGRQPPPFDAYYLVNLFFAHFFLSCMVGYICTLVFESPFMILTKLALEGGGKKPAPKREQIQANLEEGEKVNKD